MSSMLLLDCSVVQFMHELTRLPEDNIQKIDEIAPGLRARPANQRFFIGVHLCMQTGADVSPNSFVVVVCRATWHAGFEG